MIKIKGANFVVVGGMGFIGQRLVAQLVKEGASVTVFDNYLYSLGVVKESLPGAQVIRVDVARDDFASKYEDLFQGVDGVFNLASMNLMSCETYPMVGFKNNIGIMYNLLHMCTMYDCKLVFSSSASVYGDAVEEPMTESHPHNFRNVYGGSKAACEDLFQAWHHKYGVQGGSLRYMNVYGPGMHTKGAYVGVIPNVLKAIADGDQPCIYGTGEECFDFIHVDDVVQANIICMAGKEGYDCYNVGADTKTSINDLVQMILEITECTDTPLHEPVNRSFLVKNRIGDSRKIWSDYEYSLIPLQIGLNQTVEWFQKGG